MRTYNDINTNELPLGAASACPGDPQLSHHESPLTGRHELQICGHARGPVCYRSYKLI